jgi:ATP-binding cassette subfamily F protein 3
MIDLISLSLQFTGEYLFRDVNLKIHSNDKIALVGANGTGKTSLLKIITGDLEPETGTVSRQRRMKIGYLPQEQVLNSGEALLQFVESADTGIAELRQSEEELTSSLSSDALNDETREELVFRLGAVHHRLEELDSFTLQSRCERILAGLGFTVSDLSRPVDEFSGGWQMRIALARILVAAPDAILLDEPTNHLDIDSLRWLISYLRAYEGSLLLVSHDRHFVNQVTTKTLEIFLRKITLFKGNYDAYLRFKEERDLMLEHKAAQQQKEIEETKRFIERFRYKATKAKQVQSRVKQLEKIEVIELPDTESAIHFNFAEAPPSGATTIELKNLSHAYGSVQVLNNIDLAIRRGEKIAFVGPNGAGKTTLAKIIAGAMRHTSGQRLPGHQVCISYYAQEIAELLDPEADIFESIEALAGSRTIPQIRALAGAFLFTGDAIFKKVQVLSGGEKSRVALMKLLLEKANFLVLDEPTNHLDFASKNILRRALHHFSGSIVIVSHDVDFLEGLVNKVIEFRAGSMKEYVGGIRYYLEKKELESAEGLTARAKQNTADEPRSTRRELKRAEAELRQQKHHATKHLKQKIASLEMDIERYEQSRVNAERGLTLPEVYSNPLLAKQTSHDYESAKAALAAAYSDWEKLSAELEAIEKQFDK